MGLKGRFSIVIGLVATFALGDLVGRLSHSQKDVMTQEQADGLRGGSAIRDKGEDASVRALRARIRDLERQLAENQARSETTKAEDARPVGEETRQERSPRRREGFRERMERMKKEDPKRYEEMTKRFESFRKAFAERQQMRQEFLSSVDTSRMSSDDKKVHNDYQELLARRDELMEQMHDEGISEDQRRAIGTELHETMGQLNALGEQERSNLLRQTIETLGFQGDEVGEIASTINDVFDVTTEWRPGRPRGRGRKE